MLFLRAVPLVALALTVVYISLFLYLRATFRDRLEGGDVRIDAAIVEARVRAYASRLRRRLAVYVYGIPAAALVVAMFLELI